MEEISEVQRGRLSQEAYEGSQIRGMCQHPGWSVLKKRIDEKISLAKNEWLNADSKEKAEEIRMKTKHYTEIYDLIKSLMMKGDNAALLLNKILEVNNTPTEKVDKEN